jgi:hypothetical protein
LGQLFVLVVQDTARPSTNASRDKLVDGTLSSFQDAAKEHEPCLDTGLCGLVQEAAFMPTSGWEQLLHDGLHHQHLQQLGHLPHNPSMDALTGNLIGGLCGWWFGWYIEVRISHNFGSLRS